MIHARVITQHNKKVWKMDFLHDSKQSANILMNVNVINECFLQCSFDGNQILMKTAGDCEAQGGRRVMSSLVKIRTTKIRTRTINVDRLCHCDCVFIEFQIPSFSAEDCDKLFERMLSVLGSLEGNSAIINPLVNSLLHWDLQPSLNKYHFNRKHDR